MMRATHLLCLGLALTSLSASQAAIYYDDAARCIRVVDFAATSPCTLQRLLALDRLYGWGKVSYDPAQDTYTITGDLWIGANDGTDTYFQIGSPEHPRETLVMQGNLVVCPYWIEGDNLTDAWWKGEPHVNRLTLGIAGAAPVAAELRFRDEAGAGYTLYLAGWPTADRKVRRGTGGQLYVHHGVITSALPGKRFGAGNDSRGMYLTGDSVVLDHATLSWIGGFATYGMESPRARVIGTLFDHVGTAVLNGRHDLAACTFTNCEIAVRDYGCLDAILTNCVFRDNDCNWTLAYSDRGLVCVDCDIAPPRRGDSYRCWKNPQTGKSQYPGFTSLRHVIVEVVDDAGRPVAGATVKAREEGNHPELGQNTTQRTDKLGRTPGQGQAGALLLAEVVKQATDTPDQPRVTEYAYRLEATAGGFAPAVCEHFRALQSWQVVRLVMRRP